jgi:hypothetical protein
VCVHRRALKAQRVFTFESLNRSSRETLGLANCFRQLVLLGLVAGAEFRGRRFLLLLLFSFFGLKLDAGACGSALLNDVS